MSDFHKTAIIDKKSEIGKNVQVGAFTVISAGARIGDDTVIMDRVHIGPRTTIGRNNVIHMGAVVGHDAQHRQSAPGSGLLTVGDDNILREYVTVHRGAEKESVTVIGSGNYLMAFSHVGHDCRLGNQITVVNAALLGGHVTLEDNCFVSGGVAVHQFCRIGRYAMVGGFSSITKDVPPFMLVDNDQQWVASINLVGLKRAGFSQETVREIKKAYQLLYLSDLLFADALVEIEKACRAPEVRHLVDFVRASKRGILPHRKQKLETNQEASQHD